MDKNEIFLEDCGRKRNLKQDYPNSKKIKTESKQEKKFRYGNYNRYYGYRNANMEKDKRITAFKEEWFNGKCCLDIGCNVAHVTLWISKHFHVKSMKGVDIDCELIKAAKNNIVNYIDEKDVLQKDNNNPTSQVATEKAVDDSSVKNTFPYNVKFVTENIVPASDTVLKYAKPQYDVIMCLSVTKWIQLNQGDEGLKRLFKKIYLLLNDNGIFILEPQPLHSYKRRKNLVPEIRENYENMKLYPDKFIKYLLSEEVGFKSAEQIEVTKHEKEGFQRPIFVLKK